MRLRTFSGATLDEAIDAVRAALGEDAVIVSTYQSRRGRGAHVTAALDTGADDRIIAAALGNEEAGAAPDDDIARVLSFHRLPRDLEGPLGSAARGAAGDEPADLIAAALDAHFAFGRLPGDGAVMVVGTPGAGKTVTLAKLAARAVRDGRRVRVVTTDTVRACAFEQLEAFTALMDLDLARAETPDDLAAAVAGEPADLVLIDTPGTNAFASQEVEDLRAFIARIAADVVLVMPAASGVEDAADAAAVFAGLGARFLHVTRLDCARRFGGPLAAAHAGSLAFAEVGATPFIANGLSPLNPTSLARLLCETAFRVAEKPVRRAAS